MEKQFEREVLERLTKIETKLDDYNGIREKVEEAHTKSKENEKEINELKEKIQWITRTLVGAIITGTVTILVAILKFVLKI